MTDPLATPGPGRPPVLDEAKRKRLIALLANGSSRRVAARYVGCAQSTITRTALRDPQFAAELAHAERSAEIEALHNLREAARNERYWRAAAWLLERRNPEDFAQRQPNVMTDEQVRQAVVALADLLLEGLSEERYHEIIRRLTNLLGISRAEWDEPIHADSLPPPLTHGAEVLEGATNDPLAKRDTCESTPSTDRDFATGAEKSPDYLRERPATQVDDSSAPARHADDATKMHA